MCLPFIPKPDAQVCDECGEVPPSGMLWCLPGIENHLYCQTCYSVLHLSERERTRQIHEWEAQLLED
jgi:hypothetical protein